MPYQKKRNYRKRAPFRKKRTYKKRYNPRRNASMVLFKSPRGFPDKCLTKLHYFDTSTYAASVSADDVWRGNSMFDPRNALGGNQPLYFDQMMLIYLKYRVLGCKIVTRFTTKSTNIDGIGYVYPNNSATGATGYSNIFIQPYVKKKVFTNERSCTIVNYISTKKLLGLPHMIVNFDNELAGTSSTNPTRTWYWHTGFYSSDFTTTMDADIHVDMTFYCQFDDRVTLDDA